MAKLYVNFKEHSPLFGSMVLSSSRAVTIIAFIHASFAWTSVPKSKVGSLPYA